MKHILVAGVIGCPVEHSLSPCIFEFLGQKRKIPVVYKRIQIDATDLSQAVDLLARCGLMGWNVTIPHKETIVSELDQLCGESKILRAVNVVQVKDGKLLGWNTDWIGIYKSFKECRVNLKNSNALIFGSGGAARAAAYALGRLGVTQFYMVNRHRQSAVQLVRQLRPLFQAQWKMLDYSEVKTLKTELKVCVNATPIGMKGIRGQLVLPPQMSSDAICFDLVYRLQTAFLEQARHRRLQTIGGLDLLIWQALAAWEIWVGPLSQQQALKRTLKQRLEKLQG